MNKPAFDLGAMLSAPAIQTAVQQIPCEKLHPYHNHKFELYTGERLDDMVASIKENGVLSPVIVQPDGDGYEILIGHNRWNACKIAGIDTIPAIIKQGLSEDEAEMYVIESNVMQRGFDNLRISEQAAVIALRHSEMFSPGKRSDIQRELALLEDPEAEANDTATLNPMGSRLDTNEEVGKEYGVSKGSVVRLIRINKLTDALKALVDSGDIAIRAGVELSFLSEKAQAVVAEQAEDFKVDMKKSKALHDAADKEGKSCISSELTNYAFINKLIIVLVELYALCFQPVKPLKADTMILLTAWELIDLESTLCLFHIINGADRIFLLEIVKYLLFLSGKRRIGFQIRNENIQHISGSFLAFWCVVGISRRSNSIFADSADMVNKTSTARTLCFCLDLFSVLVSFVLTYGVFKEVIDVLNALACRHIGIQLGDYQIAYVFQLFQC